MHLKEPLERLCVRRPERKPTSKPTSEVSTFTRGHVWLRFLASMSVGNNKCSIVFGGTHMTFSKRSLLLDSEVD